MQTKKCTRCGIIKPINKFGFAYKDRNIRNSHCKSCYVERSRLWRQTKPVEYMIWAGIKKRCKYTKHKSFANYGGRGIAICKRWENSFAAFWEDMGPRPTPKHQIDRINNNGNYEPSNCKWSTPSENAKNRSTCKLSLDKVNLIRILLQKHYTMSRLCDLFSVSISTIYDIKHERTWKECTFRN